MNTATAFNVSARGAAAVSSSIVMTTRLIDSFSFLNFSNTSRVDAGKVVSSGAALIRLSNSVRRFSSCVAAFCDILDVSSAKSSSLGAFAPK